MTIRVFEVGGSIRDELLGFDSKDRDFTITAPSFVAMRDHLITEGYKIFVETPQYLTIRAHFPKGHEFETQTADFVLARKEGAYSDGRRPDSVEPGTIEDDLARRDFSINAMAREVGTKDLLDPFNGRGDLERRVLRAVGSASDRINEDALRAVRALRFQLVKGLILEQELKWVLQEGWVGPLVEKISRDRVRDELNKMMRFDTLGALNLLTAQTHGLQRGIFAGGLWLKPTLEQNRSNLI